MTLKNCLKVAASGVLVVPFLLATNVSAHNVGHELANNDQVLTAQSETEKTQEQKLQELKERLAKRKSELKEKLSASAKIRLQSRCKNSQGSLSSLSGRIHGLETSRNQKYGNLNDRLTKLSTRLSDAGLDVTTLDEQISELETLVETFKTDLATYKQAVSDLAEMDCAADPDAFKASLEEARTLREKLRQDSAAIKTYLKDTIKPTLVQLKEQLAAQSGEQD